MTLAEANVKFSSTGADQVKADADAVGQKLDTVSKKAVNAGFSIKNMVAGNLVGNLLQRLGDNIWDLGKNILEMGMSFQTTNAQFEALGMNANTTRDFISKVAAASTLTTKELTSLATSLQLSGFNIYRVLPAFGKLADLAGKDQDKLQGMVRLLNVLRTGARPDQELLQSLKMPTLLSEAGLKFDKGKLVGDISAALESVIKVIESKTKGISGALGKTFEASFSSLIDQFDRIKETVGDKILQWAQPWVDALTRVLRSLYDSGVWKDVLAQFFNRGIETQKKLASGILAGDALKSVTSIISEILSQIAFMPAKIEILFKYLVPAIKEYFKRLANDPALAGLFAVLRKISEYDIVGQSAKQKRFEQASIEMQKKGLITQRESMQVTLGQGTPALMQKISDYIDKKESPFSDILITELAKKEEERKKFSNDINYRLSESIKKSQKGVQEVIGKGNVTTKDAMLGDNTEVAKPKKEKQTSLLEMIVQNTAKANELTLRNMTYGGGQLAAQGISAVQMSNYRSVASPRINATNDISRGVKKEVDATTNSNFLNFSRRRS